MKRSIRILATIMVSGTVIPGYATCDSASNPAAGSTVSCTGTTTGAYRVTTQNVSITNDGSWTGALNSNGTIIGASYRSRTETSAFTLTNNGSMDFTVSVVGSGYRGNMNSGISVNFSYPIAGLTGEYTVTNNGQISITDNTAASFSGFSSISAITNGDNALTSVINASGAEITSYSKNNNSYGVAIAGNAYIENNGLIHAYTDTPSTSGGAAGAYTFGRYYNNRVYSAAASATVINTGTILSESHAVSPTTNYSIAGVAAAGTTDYLLDNRGTIRLIIEGDNSAFASQGGTVLLTNLFDWGRLNYADINAEFTINNSGSIETEGHDVAINSLFADDQAPLITINNSETGLIDGRVFTASNNDILTNAGQITGVISMAEGDDTLNIEAASQTSDADLGDGSDIANINGNPTSLGLLDGGDDVDTADTWIDTLNLNGYSGALIDYQNFEDVNLVSSTVDFGDSYSSPESINFTVDADSTLTMAGGGSGDYTINSNLENNGTFDFIDGSAGDHLTIASHDSADGNLTGNGSYQFDTDFYNKQSDSITVEGNVAAQGSIAINNVTTYQYNDYSNTDTGEAEAEQASQGYITLIEAPNDSDKSDESFVLIESQRYEGNTNLGKFDNNPFVWSLDTEGNNWVLAYAKDPREEYTEETNNNDDDDTDTGSNDNTDTDTGSNDNTDTDTGDSSDNTDTKTNNDPVVLSEIPIYTALPTIGREMAMGELDRLHQRLGELRNFEGWVGSGPSTLGARLGNGWNNQITFDQNKANVWIRGNINDIDINSSGDNYDLGGTYGGFDIGLDKRFQMNNDWSVYTGVFGGYKTGNFHSDGNGNEYQAYNRASTDIRGWSIGAYGTFFGTGGTYVDLVADYQDLTAKLHSSNNRNVDGYSVGGSVEVGQSLDLAENWIIEPQGQVKVAYVNWDNFHSGNTRVNIDDTTFVTGRLGARLEHTGKTDAGEIKPWIYAGVLHEFADTRTFTTAAEPTASSRLTTTKRQRTCEWV